MSRRIPDGLLPTAARRIPAPLLSESHERTHTGERPFACTFCDKRFTESGHLYAHERTHTGERSFACALCDKRFTQSGGLKKHERTHTGERPFACALCDKRFTQGSALQRHERMHAGESHARSDTVVSPSAGTSTAL